MQIYNNVSGQPSSFRDDVPTLATHHRKWVSSRDVQEAILAETETLKPKNKALIIQAEVTETKAFRARDRDKAEVYQLRGKTRLHPWFQVSH